MTDVAVKPALQPPEAAPSASVLSIFLQFLIIGATSFGGVVPYLRDRLVVKTKWINDKEFVEMLSISQSLPGLNATNMAVLVGEKLQGAMGALAGLVGMCLPGAVLMYIVGIFYKLHGDHPWSTAALKGVAAAAVGLILVTVVNLSKKALSRKFDFVFMAATVLAVNRFHWSVPKALIIVGILAILFHRPTGHHESSEVTR